MFKEMFTSIVEKEELVIYKGSTKSLEKIDDALYDWNNKNDFAFQEYYSHKTGSDERSIVVDDVKGYKKYKKTFEDIIKKYK